MSEISYAVLTRAKAKYGKRLKKADYKSLLECDSIAEVMSYLKTNTHYIKAFGEANERDIRRGLFEFLLRQHITYEFDTICRYELTVGEYFSKFITHQTEINEIVRILTILGSNNKKKKEFSFTLPAHMSKNTSIDLAILEKATNYEEFQNALANTSFESVFKKYKLKDGDPIPVNEIENNLYNSLYKELYKAIDKTGGEERQELHELYDTIIDYENFIRIIRLKKYYNAVPDEIIKQLLPFGSLSTKKLRDMCYSENSQGVFAIMGTTKQGRLIKNIDYSYAGEIPNKVRFKKARQNMYLSDNPATVMMSYIILSEIELLNLICIVEGVRYKVNKDNIEALLIY